MYTVDVLGTLWLNVLMALSVYVCLRARLYSSAKLTAKDLCIICYYADLAGVAGADFSLYSRPPDAQPGKFQAHLDRVLPEPKCLFSIATPCNPNRGPLRKIVHIPVRLACDSLADEIETDDTTRRMMDAPCDERPQCVLDTPAYRCPLASNKCCWLLVSESYMLDWCRCRATCGSTRYNSVVFRAGSTRFFLCNSISSGLGP